MYDTSNLSFLFVYIVHKQVCIIVLNDRQKGELDSRLCLDHTSAHLEIKDWLKV